MDIYQVEYIERLKYDNSIAWRNGMYNYEALVSALSSAFGGKKSKAIPYPKEPHRIFQKTEEEKRMDAEREKQKAIAFFDSMARKFENDNQNAIERHEVESVVTQNVRNR